MQIYVKYLFYAFENKFPIIFQMKWIIVINIESFIALETELKSNPEMLGPCVWTVDLY